MGPGPPTATGWPRRNQYSAFSAAFALIPYHHRPHRPRPLLTVADVVLTPPLPPPPFATTSDPVPAPSSGHPGDALDSFAAAISARYAQQTTPLISINSPSLSPPKSSLMAQATAAATPSFMPPPISFSKSLPSAASSSGAASSSVALPPSAFTTLPPSALKGVLSDPSALILDIRPHNAYAQARLPNALSLSVPSTLLKRPLFSLSKLADMLPTSSAREKFSKWPDASRILVYDADSASIPQTQASNLLGLMRKFRGEGFPQEREVAWLRGGFHAVWRDYPDLVSEEPPAEEVEEDDMQAEAEAAPMGKTMSAPPATRALRAKQLPMSAFTSATTIPLRPRVRIPRLLLLQYDTDPWAEAAAQNLQIAEGLA